MIKTFITSREITAKAIINTWPNARIGCIIQRNGDTLIEWDDRFLLAPTDISEIETAQNTFEALPPKPRPLSVETLFTMLKEYGIDLTEFRPENKKDIQF